LDDLRHNTERLKSGDVGILPLAEFDDQGILIGGLAKRCLEMANTGINESTRDRYLDNFKQLSSFFQAMAVAPIGLATLERPTIKQAHLFSKAYFTKGRDVLIRIFGYGIKGETPRAGGCRLPTLAAVVSLHHRRQACALPRKAVVPHCCSM
jgi:hypothetical protein